VDGSFNDQGSSGFLSQTQSATCAVQPHRLIGPRSDNIRIPLVDYLRAQPDVEIVTYSSDPEACALGRTKRFLVAQDRDVDCFLVRDLDSRLSLRERFGMLPASYPQEIIITYPWCTGRKKMVVGNGWKLNTAFVSSLRPMSMLRHATDFSKKLLARLAAVDAWLDTTDKKVCGLHSPIRSYRYTVAMSPLPYNNVPKYRTRQNVGDFQYKMYQRVPLTFCRVR
jgi:hypothetical protein